MRMEMNASAAWGCVLAGMLIYALVLMRHLRRQGDGSALWKTSISALLPAGMSLLFAWGGFALLQAGESVVSFRWCYTTGLWGAVLGTTLAAKLEKITASSILDNCAAALCLAMAFARAAQRWLGETGIGPLMDNASFLTMINEWEEPALATWMIECAACLIAAGVVWLYGRKKRGPGCAFCLAVFWLMIPQILIEQFRSGAYMRFMMMRLEQVLFAVSVLGALIYLAGRIRNVRGWLCLVLFLALAGGVALVQFILDGKILEWPAGLSWTVYGALIAGMLINGFVAVRMADKAPVGKETERE